MAIKKDPDAAEARHYAAHPKDRDANIVIFEFYDDEDVADERQDCAPSAESTREEP